MAKAYYAYEKDMDSATTVFADTPSQAKQIARTCDCCEGAEYIDIRREAWPSSEVQKIFTGDYLGEWGEDEDGNECVCILGVVTYWEDEGRYVLADEDGLCNDWTLEDEAQPENWPNLIHCGNIHDGEGGQHEGAEHD